MYENPWTLDGVPFDTSDIGSSQGFVYLVTDMVTGRLYVGRKYFWSTRKVKGKKRRQTTESDWKTYHGSNDEIAALLKEHGTSRFKREIISIHKTKGDTNIAEVREQFARDVLQNDLYMNGNINGKWFKQPDHVVAARILSGSSCLMGL